ALPDLHLLVLRRAPRHPTPFPSTTLFRSEQAGLAEPPAPRRFPVRRRDQEPAVGPEHPGDLPENAAARLEMLDHVEEKHGVEARSEEHTSELQSPDHLVCRLLLEKKKATG